MRRAVFDALALAGRFPHTSALADAAVTRVLVVDEAQRLPVPCLEYLQSLWDHPGTRITLVLCGAGSERALSRLPQLASRIGAWQKVARLTGAEVATVVTGFHPLWRTAPAPDLTWIDRSCARHVPHVGRFDCTPAERAAHHRWCIHRPGLAEAAVPAGRAATERSAPARDGRAVPAPGHRQAHDVPPG